MKVISQRGVHLDVGKFIAENPEQVAIGNAKMNARGDKIGRGGVVIKRREDIAAEYHRSNPKAVKQVSIKKLQDEIIMSPAEAVAAVQKEQAQLAEARKAKEEAELQARIDADLRGPVPETETGDSNPAGKKRKISDSE